MAIATGRLGTVEIDKEKCKGCEICVKVCPVDVLEMTDEVNEWGYHIPRLKADDVCTGCKVCAWMCPDYAIIVFMKREASHEA